MTQRLALIAIFAYLGGFFTPSGIVWAQQRKTISLDPSEILADACNLVGHPEQPMPDKILIHHGERVAFMGDSITANGGYIRLAEAALKANYPDLKLTAFVNAGRGSNSAEDMQPRFANDMRLAERPAWVFINVGLNDIAGQRLNSPHDWNVLKNYKQNVSQMVDEAQLVGAKVVLLTPTLFTEDPESEGNKRLVLYVNVMKKIGEEKACIVIDLHEMFLTALRHKTPGVPLTIDGLHMAVYGDAIMAVGVLRALGVPDAVIAQTDTLPQLQCRVWNMPAKRVAELLEIPTSRFAKADFIRGFAF